MDFVKQYIIQCIGVSANNLRLSSEKIEVIALLKHSITTCENLEVEIQKMKKVTEFARLAIRLHEIYNFLTQTRIDFIKISEKFKEHCQFIIKDVNQLLESVNPVSFKEAIAKLSPPKTEGNDNSEIEVDLQQRSNRANPAPEFNTIAVKEKLILEEEKEDENFFFQNYEASILKPIKEFEELLKKLARNEAENSEVDKFAKVMLKNSVLSEKFGSEVVANMLKIVAKALMLTRTKELVPSRDLVESIRACIIVIVAVVRNKEVDISIYLNRAEDFGKRISLMKIKGIGL